MTLDEIRREIWTNLGEPTDLDPAEDVSYNGGPLLTWVANEAQRQIAVWKDFVTGRRIRFRELFGSDFMRLTKTGGTLAANPAPSGWVIDLDDGSPIVGDINQRFKGWIFECRGQRRVVVDHDESNLLTLSSPISPVPEIGDEYSLYKRFVFMLSEGAQYAAEHYVLPQVNGQKSEGNLIEVLKISDMVDKSVLTKAQKNENFIRRSDEVSFPRAWYRFGSRIVFDSAPPEERWYELEYYRLPAAMVEATDEPEIPEMFHYALVLWGTEWGMRRQRENSEKYATGQDLQRFMRTMLSQYEMEYDRESDSGIYRKV